MGYIADEIRLPPDKPRVVEVDSTRPAIVDTGAFLRRLHLAQYMKAEAVIPELNELSLCAGCTEEDTRFLEGWAKTHWERHTDRIGALVNWYATRWGGRQG